MKDEILTPQELEYRRTVEAYDKLIERLQSIYVTAKIYPKVFEKEEFRRFHKYFDRILFTILSQIDLVIGLKYLLINGKNDRAVEAKYFARMVALTCYEILNHTPKFLSKDTRRYIETNMGLDALNSMMATMKELYELKQTHHALLYDIRTHTVAHKDADAIRQADMIKNMNALEVYNIGRAVYDVLQNLISKFIGLLKYEKKPDPSDS